MKLKCYCVTVMDHWTPTREFWTYKGALAFRNEHLGSAYLHQWFNGGWVEIVRPPVTNANPCPGCDGHECDNGCAYPGALGAVGSAPDSGASTSRNPGASSRAADSVGNAAREDK